MAKNGLGRQVDLGPSLNPPSQRSGEEVCKRLEEEAKLCWSDTAGTAALHGQDMVCALAEELRRTIAQRRDALEKRQRRKYVAKRAQQIDQLGDDYRRVLDIALRAGAEKGCGR